MKPLSRRERIFLWSWLAFVVAVVVVLDVVPRVGAEGDPDTQAFWLRKLDRGTPEERQSACSILGAWENKSQRTIEALIEVAEAGPEPELRRTAVVGLRDQPEAVSVLGRIAAGDPDSTVQEMACLVRAGCIEELRNPESR